MAWNCLLTNFSSNSTPLVITIREDSKLNFSSLEGNNKSETLTFPRWNMIFPKRFLNLLHFLPLSQIEKQNLPCPPPHTKRSQISLPVAQIEGAHSASGTEATLSTLSLQIQTHQALPVQQRKRFPPDSHSMLHFHSPSTEVNSFELKLVSFPFAYHGWSELQSQKAMT